MDERERLYSPLEELKFALKQPELIADRVGQVFSRIGTNLNEENLYGDENEMRIVGATAVGAVFGLLAALTSNGNLLVADALALEEMVRNGFKLIKAGNRSRGMNFWERFHDEKYRTYWGKKKW